MNIPLETQESLDCLDSVERLLRHLHLVQGACELMGKKLIRNGEEEFGLKLISLGFIHDNSKFSGDEWSCLCRHKSHDSNELTQAIELHRSKNAHHPEFYQDIRQMPREHLWEMVADIWSRSVELGGDVRDYLFTVLPERFGFADQAVEENRRIWKELEKALAFLLEEHL